MKKEKYKINYSFDGSGTVIVEAKNEEEAEEKYDNGEWLSHEEDGDCYFIQSIEKA